VGKLPHESLERQRQPMLILFEVLEVEDQKVIWVSNENETK